MNKIIASILIIVVLGLTIWYVADNQKQLPLTGGGCAYKEYPGKCTINGVVVKNADPDSGGSFESPTVNYTFVPAGSVDVSGTYLSSADKINPYNGITAASYLGLYCLRGPFSPNYHQTLNCGVLDGALFDCVLSVATAGSCNPINILFVDSGSCAKEGEYQGYSAGRSDVKRQCCAGLSAFAATNVSNPSTLCYDPAKGVPICKNPGAEKAGFYYPDGTVVRYERCVDRALCNESLNAEACKATGGNYFSDNKCYCTY